MSGCLESDNWGKLATECIAEMTNSRVTNGRVHNRGTAVVHDTTAQLSHCLSSGESTPKPLFFLFNMGEKHVFAGGTILFLDT